MDNYLVYVLLNPNKIGQYTYGDIEFEFEPFYVGKGLPVRPAQHLCECFLKNSNKWKANIIRKIKRTGKEPIIFTIYNNLSNNESMNRECKLISLIGRKDKGLGPLVNLTDGGEGISGYEHSNKTKEKIKSYWTPERKRETSIRLKLYWTDERKRERSNKYLGESNPAYGIKRPDLSVRNKETNYLKRGKSNVNAKKYTFIIENIKYNDSKKISEHYEICNKTVSNRCNSEKWPDWESFVINGKENYYTGK